MTSTGIRRRRNTDDRTDEAIKQVEDAYIRKAKTFTDRGRQETGNVGPAAIGGPSIPGASYLPISGKYGMIGSIAFNPIAKLISDGRINVTPDQDGSSKDSSYILVTAQGSPDDLRFIDGATKNGQIFWFQGTATQIINIKHATITTISSISGLGTVTVVTGTNHNMVTNDKANILLTDNFNISDVTITRIDDTTFTYTAIGNITPETSGVMQNGNVVTPDGEDIVLDGTVALNGIPMVPLIFDPSVLGFGAWRPAQLTTGSGGGGVSFPITPPVNILGSVSTNQAINLSLDTGHTTTLTLTGDIDITFTNYPSSGTQIEWEVQVTQDVTGGRVITWPSEVLNPPSLDTTALTTTVIVFRTNDGGTIVRVGNTVTTGVFGVTNLSDLTIDVKKDWLGFGITSLSNLEFQITTGAPAGTVRTVYTDSAGMIFNMPTASPVFTHSVNNAIFSLLTNGELNIRTTLVDGPTLRLQNDDQTPTANDESATILFTGETDPISIESTYASIVTTMSNVGNTSKQGEFTVSVQHDNILAPIINYTGDDATFRFSSGVDVVRPNANGSKELGTSSFYWDDVFSETFTLRGSGGNTAGTDRTVYADSAGMIFNMPTASPVFTHSVNNEVFSLLSDSELELRTTLVDGYTLRLRNNDQTPTSNDTAATILFTGEDGALNEQVYGSIKVEMDVVTAGGMIGDMDFRARNGTSLKPWMNYLGGLDKVNLFQTLDLNSHIISAVTDPVDAQDAATKNYVDNVGSGANVSLSNLTSPTAINQNLIPDGTVTLGATGAASTWDDAFIETINAVSSIIFNNAQNIFSTGTNLVSNVPTNSLFRFQDNSITYTELANTGMTITRRTTASSQFAAALLNLQRRDTTIADNDFVGLLNFQGDDADANLTTYAEIRGVANSITAGSEDGGLSISVRNNTSLNTVIEMEASGGNLQLGFFGVAPVARQSPAANSAAIITALESLGLFV